jgi:hypothetical protein
MQAPEPESAALARGRGVNWYWLAVLVSCVALPFASEAFCEGEPRGHRPYFQFLFGYMCLSVPVFLIGVSRSARFHRANTALVPLIVSAWVVVGGWHLLLHFTANFAV